ncbi:UNVERIFIED_CONTAM: Calnexin1 [Sesamum angustifolium]|uniref:Calnexin1 n=1 Tax=Sesamum angustifolium TaxID=2727405 RepID=A0AAW2RIY2_9LAMI
MEDPNRKIWIMQCLLLLSIACFVAQLYASDDVKFYEPFDEKFEGRWIASEKSDYTGVWKHEKSEGHDDHGLLVSEKARKYAIVKELDEPVKLKDGTIVLQYEVRLQNGLECGGAYIKYLRPQDAGWAPKEFDNESPYTIMFGPDKCGVTNKTIPDPDDKKPEDWDERAKIPDPAAKKPDDWDEDAPMEIEDEDAVKPEGWLDDEPEEIDDPEATKPEDWDDEEDGEWEAPKIDNPKCLEAPGCGEWKRPSKRNPAYKGKWQPPLIDNPNYKGIWKPQEIPNPEYFELDRPNFEPIAAVGIEIWTMQDGILFNNILIASSEKVAESYRETAWKPKFEVEKEKQKEEEAKESDGLKGVQKVCFDYLYKVADLPFLGEHKAKVLDLIEKAEKQPNLTIGILVSVVVVIFSIFFKLIFGGKKPAAVTAATKKPDVAETSNQGSTEEKDEQNDDAAAAPRRRNTRRDN